MISLVFLRENFLPVGISVRARDSLHFSGESLGADANDVQRHILLVSQCFGHFDWIVDGKAVGEENE